MTTAQSIRQAALVLFEAGGVEETSVAAICRAAGVSNGSFFHAFATKDALAGDLYLSALETYHAAVLKPLARQPTSHDGIRALVRAHVMWVVKEKASARFIFEQARAQWLDGMREPQAQENAAFLAALNAWRQPLVENGTLRAVPDAIFVSQLIGPAQLICRGWLAGRTGVSPRSLVPELAEAACRALCEAESPS